MRHDYTPMLERAKEKGLTLAELLKEAGVPNAYAPIINRGFRINQWKYAKKLADYLGFEGVNDLFVKVYDNEIKKQHHFGSFKIYLTDDCSEETTEEIIEDYYNRVETEPVGLSEVNRVERKSQCIDWRKRK